MCQVGLHFIFHWIEVACSVSSSSLCCFQNLIHRLGTTPQGIYIIHVTIRRRPMVPLQLSKSAWYLHNSVISWHYFINTPAIEKRCIVRKNAPHLRHIPLSFCTTTSLCLNWYVYQFVNIPILISTTLLKNLRFPSGFNI